MSTILVAVPACHFASSDRFCSTTKVRLKTAYTLTQQFIAKGHQVIIEVSGQVPYRRGTPMLNELMRWYLVAKGVASERVILGEGIGIADDSRNVMCSLVPKIGADAVCLVSSKWYWLAGKPFWQKHASTLGVPLTFVGIKDQASWRTWVVYLLYGLVVRFASRFGLRRGLERLLTKRQKSRRQGFTRNGCA